MSIRLQTRDDRTAAKRFLSKCERFDSKSTDTLTCSTNIVEFW